jgi:histidinol-phosphate aminotransferase
MNHTRPELRNVRDVPHGSTHRSDIIDFSSSVIPLTLPLENLINCSDFFRYPDTSSSELREVISKDLNIEPQNIVCGNGASELIWLIGLACLSAQTNAGALIPTFGEYERISKIMGAHYNSFAVEEKNNFQTNIDALSEWIAKTDVSVFFLCNPNNPTGHYIPTSQIEALVLNNPRCLFVIDFAYVDYTADFLPLPKWTSLPNIICLFSLTKAFGIAGIRSGYAIGCESLIRAINIVRPPWNMNVLAQKISAYLIQNKQQYKKVVENYRSEAIRFITCLEDMGQQVIPSSTDYFMLKTANAREFKANMLQKGYLVRELESMGCPHFVRINMCTKDENDKFLNELRIHFG